MPARRPPAMSDVAALAGVSHQTVSRVLNGHPSVLPATRQRVLDAIAQLLGEDPVALRDRTPASLRLLVEQGFLQPVPGRRTDAKVIGGGRKRTGKPVRGA